MRKALLIGINYYGTSAELRGCINDVKHIQEFLKTEYKFNDNEFMILTDDQKDPHKIPTRKNILDGFNWILDGQKADSRLFIHYSGHGSWTLDLNGDEIDGRDETIVPVDYQKTGMIIDDDIRADLVDQLITGAKLTCIFDCCHSGTVLDLRYVYTLHMDNRLKNYAILEDTHYKKTKGDVYLLSGCRDDQQSADAWEDRKSQGAMTYGFLKIYKKLQTGGKKPSYKALMGGIQKLLKEKGYQQVPQISSGKLINLDDEFNVL